MLTEKNYGLTHCAHHNVHFEYCWDFDERRNYILKEKPESEIPVREKNFIMFPTDRLPPIFAQLDAVQVQLQAERVKLDAREVQIEAERSKLAKAEDKLQAEWVKLEAEWVKLEAEWVKLDGEWGNLRTKRGKTNAEYEKAIEENMPEIMKLHAELCPDCTWDEKRKTIF